MKRQREIDEKNKLNNNENKNKGKNIISPKKK